jgi:FkbM family methyltransferase
MKALKGKLESWVYGTRLAIPAALVSLRLAAIGNSRNRQSYDYKRRILAIMRRVLRDDSNAVDIGSHRGLYLFAFLQHAPRGRHIAIEPVPDLAGDLLKRFPAVDVHAVALSDTKGSTDFYIDHQEPGYSSLFAWERKNASRNTFERIVVPIQTLDDLVPLDCNIDLIKMDAMGAHVKILRGALKTILRCRPVMILYLRTPPGGDPPSQSAADTWDIVVEQGNLGISRVADWVAGRPALSRTEFLSCVGHHEGSEFCFVASPARP